MAGLGIARANHTAAATSCVLDPGVASRPRIPARGMSARGTSGRVRTAGRGAVVAFAHAFDWESQVLLGSFGARWSSGTGKRPGGR